MPPKKMGRPPADNPKSKTLRIRVDDKTIETLEEISKSEVVRKGIGMVKDSLKK